MTEKTPEIIRVKIKPFGAVRSTAKGKFNKLSAEYHENMNYLRLLIGSEKEKIIQALINGNCQIRFYHEIPKSWSNKKKISHQYLPKDSKPDIDNLWKAVVDTLFYKYKVDDSKVWLCYGGKFRAGLGESGYIEFIIS